ncbi:hypothetical protein [Amycolatopsis sp. NPDC049159]|uniref:hypothetical protein n=1 Tax=unclassified Amycolatopsis TaxID=2618356 RepID=UPI0033F6C929
MAGRHPTADGGKDPGLLRAENAASRLHKNAGVRGAGLPGKLGADLRRIWAIETEAPPVRVCAIVCLRLLQVLDSMVEPKPELVHAAYNIGPEPLSANLGTRLESLPGRSARSHTRDLEHFQEALYLSLRTPKSPFGEREIIRAQQRLAGRTVPPPSPIEGFHANADDVVRWFLDQSWCAPADLAREPIVVDLGPRGAWLCVFRDEHTLAGYRDAVGCHWPSGLQATGREFVGRAGRRATPTGLLVDPSARRGTGAERSFSLPPSLIAELSPGSPG